MIEMFSLSIILFVSAGEISVLGADKETSPDFFSWAALTLVLYMLVSGTFLVVTESAVFFSFGMEHELKFITSRKLANAENSFSIYSLFLHLFKRAKRQIKLIMNNKIMLSQAFYECNTASKLFK